MHVIAFIPMIQPVRPIHNNPQILAEVIVCIVQTPQGPKFGVKMPQGQKITTSMRLLVEGMKMLTENIQDPEPIPQTNVVLPDGSKAKFKPQPIPDDENVAGLPPAPIHGEKTNGSGE